MDDLQRLAQNIAACNDGADWHTEVKNGAVVATHRATGSVIRCTTAEEFALAVEAWAESGYRN